MKEILAIDPSAVIFTMSGRDEDFQEVAMRLGARRGFRKPVGVRKLLSALYIVIAEHTRSRRS